MITLDPKLRYALALALMPGMGPQHVRTLGACFEDISQPFREPQLLDQHFPRMQRRVRVLFESSQLLCEADRLLERCQQLALTPLFLLNPDYPQALAECPDAPLILYTRGASEVLQQAPLISVVGTRQASSYGLQMTGRVVTELSEVLPQSPIVSGLAYGIDIEVHRRALLLGTPCVAVLAHGLDRLYPSVHRPEAERILSSGGMLVSEYPPGTPTQRKQFVARNRIIAGLSVATILRSRTQQRFALHGTACPQLWARSLCPPRAHHGRAERRLPRATEARRGSAPEHGERPPRRPQLAGNKRSQPKVATRASKASSASPASKLQRPAPAATRRARIT